MSRFARVAIVVALALAVAVPTGTASVATKTTNACKLLRSGEIEEALGQPTGKGKKGLSAGPTSACEWQVDAADELPSGVIATFIQRAGAKIAFDTNSEAATAEEVPELGGKSYYDSAFDSLYVLKGDRLMFVQAVFITAEGGIEPIARRDELVALAKIARKRL